VKRTVKVGSDRRIQILVTDFIRGVLTDPASNRRLIVGSITGQRIARAPDNVMASNGLAMYFMRTNSVATRQAR
jgi:hypothetical protein